MKKLRFFQLQLHKRRNIAMDKPFLYFCRSLKFENISIMIKKIFPIEWKEIHPEAMVSETDFYYAELANKVLKVLDKSGIESVLPEKSAIRTMAIRLTGWFEDLCSELGFWSVVNTICRQRYGKALPFYDTSEYYPGEPNPQDIQLLLWDFIQTLNEDRFINPENPGIEMVAYKIFDIFYQEYEYAPVTEELKAYFADPAIGTDYWKTRKAIEYIVHRGYFSFHSEMLLLNSLFSLEEDEGIENEEQLNIFSYATMIIHAFSDRHNLLSLTAGEWLSAATGKKFTVDAQRLKNRVYTLGDLSGTTLQLIDKEDGNIFMVENDSFNANWLREYGYCKGMNVSCGLIRFNDKYYQCGTMVTDPRKSQMKKILEKQKEETYFNSLAKENRELFLKASHGEPIVFLKGKKELMNFYSQNGTIVMPKDFNKQLKYIIDEHSEDGLVAIMSSPDKCYLIITCSIPAIKAPNNPYYDHEYAKLHAHELMLSDKAIDYSAVCELLSLGYLPDAAINSSKGYEYGRELLQNNAQFVVDYMFANHQ